MRIDVAYRTLNTVVVGKFNTVHISPDFVAKILSYWNAKISNSKAAQNTNHRPLKSLRQAERIEATCYFDNMLNPMVPDRNHKQG